MVAITDTTAKTPREAIDLMQIVTGVLEDGLRPDDQDRRAILKEVKDAETAIAKFAGSGRVSGDDPPIGGVTHASPGP